MTLLSIILFLVLIGILCYHKTSLALSTVLLLAYTAVMGVLDIWSYWMLLPVALVLFPFVFTPVRQSLFSARALKMFQKVMPPMSRTEKEAIDAGTTWWEGDLFRGAPDWNKLHNYPKPQLTAEEQAFIDGPVETVCGMVNDFAVSHELSDLPPEVWQYLRDHRFFAMIIKKNTVALSFPPMRNLKSYKNWLVFQVFLLLLSVYLTPLVPVSYYSITVPKSRNSATYRVWRPVKRSLVSH